MGRITVSQASLRLRADGASYERGLDYFEADRVRQFTMAGAGARATVVGTRPYRVRLRATGAGLAGECTCPYGAEGAFCKHCVAAGLAWLESGGPTPAEPNAEPSAGPEGTAHLRAFLRAQDPAWLTEELLRAAEGDLVLRARLQVAAGANPRDAYDDTALRDRLERAIDIHDFADQKGADSYLLGVHEVVDEIEELTSQGFADAATELAEYAVELLEESADMIGDCGGGMRGLLARAKSVHLDACRAGHPDPEGLAGWLVERALASDHDVFQTGLPDYADVLGTSGVARCQEVVEAARRPLPPHEPGRHDPRRPAVTSLADKRAGHEGGAVGSLWTNFTESPCLETYQRLYEAAGDGLPRWRERALALLREQPRLTDTSKAVRFGGPTGHSTLVEVLLWEGDAEAAWDAAQDGGCRNGLWLRLARKRADSHPADAIPIFQRTAELAIERMDRPAYHDAAALLAEAYACAQRRGRDEAFCAYMARLRGSHRTKRALQEELDRARLPG